LPINFYKYPLHMLFCFLFLVFGLGFLGTSNHLKTISKIKHVLYHILYFLIPSWEISC
jgi:hypothetical protein